MKLENIDTEKKTPLTVTLLEKLEFRNKPKCNFPLFENAGCWIKNGICLFYNKYVEDVEDVEDTNYYVGFVEMRAGRYVAVAFKWISTLEELTPIYESITNKPIKN